MFIIIFSATIKINQTQVYFEFPQADSPDTNKIPVQDALGVTIVLVICSYLGKEFVRVGYYVNNDYTDPEMRDNPPEIPQFDKVSYNLDKMMASNFLC